MKIPFGLGNEKSEKSEKKRTWRVGAKRTKMDEILYFHGKVISSFKTDASQNDRSAPRLTHGTRGHAFLIRVFLLHDSD